MNNSFFKSGFLADGEKYSIYGQTPGGEIIYDDDMVVAGGDVVLVLPDHKVLAVFENIETLSADYSVPEQAAQMAARSIRSYYLDHGGESVEEAMEFARSAVEANPEAGICIGSLAAIVGDRISLAKTGNMSVAVRDAEAKETEFIIDKYPPSPNLDRYLGKRTSYDKLRKSDELHNLDIGGRAVELYLMSDGVYGRRQLPERLQPYHFEAARQDYQLLKEARLKLRNLDDLVRSSLRGVAGRRLLDRQLEEGTNSIGQTSGLSPELENPEMFSSEGFDWDIWQEIVLPIVSRFELSPKFGDREMLESLIKRPIRWSHERPRRDDATVVVAHLGQS
ncbi:hypothetical protein B7Y94_00565 [Candidatus Saccharibacteria bacterium 32-49-12]|nr:MAG: hypothetical protein B7Y94_00565 [Candidatus Saccharibacteria bacterium 32-49-12]